jgi:HK97 family phage major capsid protein
MLTYLRRLTDERDSLTQSATDLADHAATDERDLTDTERSSLTAWQTRCAEIDAQLTEYNAQAESQRAYARLRDTLHDHDDDAEPRRPAGRVQQRQADTARGWGDSFIESDAFKGYVGAGSSARVEVAGVYEERAAVLDRLQTRAPIDTGDGIAVPYIYTPPTPNFPTPLLSVCGHVTVANNSVSWVQWTPQPPPAAGVVVEGALKPEMTMTATPTSDTLETIAHWKEITRQALEDIPQIRATVETRLRAGIFRKLEADIAVALAAAPIPPVTSGSAAAGDTLLAAIRVGLAEVETNGYTPNAVLLNPADAADIDLAIMAGTLLGPTQTAGVWGLRVVGVSGLPAGTAYVGDFAQAVTVFDRGTTAVYLSDSHADNFIRNVLLLLAEIRALATVPEPQAAAKCSVGALATRSASAGK